jgi:hypothetical protein
MLIAGIAGFVLGVGAVLAFNYFFPAKVDEITKKASDEVKERL